jgi:hypothetical protein
MGFHGREREYGRRNGRLKSRFKPELVTTPKKRWCGYKKWDYSIYVLSQAIEKFLGLKEGATQ